MGDVISMFMAERYTSLFRRAVNSALAEPLSLNLQQLNFVLLNCFTDTGCCPKLDLVADTVTCSLWGFVSSVIPLVKWYDNETGHTAIPTQQHVGIAV
jgi:hypothetical protein